MLSTLYEGRINRVSFSSLLLIMMFFGAVLGISHIPQSNPAAYYLIVIIAIIFMQSYTIKRLHDLGFNGWFSLLNFVPYLNVIFFLFLLTKKGQQKKNKYGDIPKKSGFLKLLRTAP